jgi:2-keto-3-deoxy-L-rhamnonate aldolase RhmA
VLNLRPNITSAKLRGGETAFGTFTLIPEPSLAELIGAAGYDFICIDMEHAAADGRAIENMIRGAQAAGITPLVRVREVEEKTILWVLDSGAEGIIVPMVSTVEDGRRAFELTRYPPLGSRTLCSATRSAGRGAYRRDFERFVEHVNSELLLIGLIETPEAVANIEELATSGIDVFLVGRADLSMKMGLTYAPHAPEVVEATERVLAAVINSGRVAGVLAYDTEDAKRWIEFGCKFIIYSHPEILLATHYADALAEMRTSAEKRTAKEEPRAEVVEART